MSEIALMVLILAVVLAVGIISTLFMLSEIRRAIADLTSEQQSHHINREARS